MPFERPGNQAALWLAEARGKRQGTVGLGQRRGWADKLPSIVHLTAESYLDRGILYLAFARRLKIF